MQVKWPSGLFSDECKFLWFLMWKFFNILLKVSWNVLSTRPLSLPFFRSAADVLWQSLWRGRDQGGGLLQVGVQQRPRRAAGQGRGPQVCHRLLHLAPWGRGRVRQQLGPLRTDGRTIGSGERILRESECSGDDSEDSESAKSFCINRKKQEKNSSTGRDCVMDRTFDHVILFSFWVSCFSLRNRMSFLKQIKTGRKDRRENAEKRFKPWEIMLFPSVFFWGLSPFFKWLFLATATLFKTLCLMTDILKKETLNGCSHLYFWWLHPLSCGHDTATLSCHMYAVWSTWHAYVDG